MIFLTYFGYIYVKRAELGLGASFALGTKKVLPKMDFGLFEIIFCVCG